MPFLSILLFLDYLILQDTYSLTKILKYKKKKYKIEPISISVCAGNQNKKYIPNKFHLKVNYIYVMFSFFGEKKKTEKKKKLFLLQSLFIFLFISFVFNRFIIWKNIKIVILNKNIIKDYVNIKWSFSSKLIDTIFEQKKYINILFFMVFSNLNSMLFNNFERFERIDYFYHLNHHNLLNCKTNLNFVNFLKNKVVSNYLDYFDLLNYKFLGFTKKFMVKILNLFIGLNLIYGYIFEFYLDKLRKSICRKIKLLYFKKKADKKKLKNMIVSYYLMNNEVKMGNFCYFYRIHENKHDYTICFFEKFKTLLSCMKYVKNNKYIQKKRFIRYFNKIRIFFLKKANLMFILRNFTISGKFFTTNDFFKCYNCEIYNFINYFLDKWFEMLIYSKISFITYSDTFYKYFVYSDKLKLIIEIANQLNFLLFKNFIVSNFSYKPTFSVLSIDKIWYIYGYKTSTIEAKYIYDFIFLKKTDQLIFINSWNFRNYKKKIRCTHFLTSYDYFVKNYRDYFLIYNLCQLILEYGIDITIKKSVCLFYRSFYMNFFLYTVLVSKIFTSVGQIGKAKSLILFGMLFLNSFNNFLIYFFWKCSFYTEVKYGSNKSYNNLIKVKNFLNIAKKISFFIYSFFL